MCENKNEYKISVSKIPEETVQDIRAFYENAGWEFVIASSTIANGYSNTTSLSFSWNKETEPFFMSGYPLRKAGEEDEE